MKMQQVLPSSPSTGFGCQLLPGFLSPDECAALQAQLEQRGFVSAEANYPPSYRNNQRLVFDDTTLADVLLARLRQWLPPKLRDGSSEWMLDAINPRWRSCRYRANEAFNPHQDGVYHAPDGRMSKLTFMVYLNQAPAFSGGDTVFFDGPPNTQRPLQEIARVAPKTGALIVFDHRLWHAGEPVLTGSKTILRSDVMYRPYQVEPLTGHRGYVFCLAALGRSRVLSGGRDGSVQCLEADGNARVVARHQQSVLGLCAIDHTRFASVSRDRYLKIHDLRNPDASISVRAHAGAALCVVSAADGSLFTGGADHTIAHWSADGRLKARWRGHQGWVFDLCLADSNRVVSVSEDGTVLLWADGQVIAHKDVATPLRSVCRSAAGWVVGDANGNMMLLALQSQQLRLIRRVTLHSAAIRRLRPVPGGGLLSASEDGTIRRWSADLTRSSPTAKREGFATDALERNVDGAIVSAGYSGGVQIHPQRVCQPEVIG